MGCHSVRYSSSVSPVHIPEKTQLSCDARSANLKNVQGFFPQAFLMHRGVSWQQLRPMDQSRSSISIGFAPVRVDQDALGHNDYGFLKTRSKTGMTEPSGNLKIFSPFSIRRNRVRVNMPAFLRSHFQSASPPTRFMQKACGKAFLISQYVTPLKPSATYCSLVSPRGELRENRFAIATAQENGSQGKSGNRVVCPS